MATLSALQYAASSLRAKRGSLTSEIDAVAHLAANVGPAVEGPFAGLLEDEIASWSADMRSSKAELYWVIRGIEQEIERLSDS